MHTQQKARIVYIDLIRAIAVLLMVEGHTVDALIGSSFRNYEDIGYRTWLFIRGFTAPVFLFTSGTVFAYLFRKDHHPFSQNPRVKKGLKRIGFLFLIGYLMHFPVLFPWNLLNNSYESIRSMFFVDVLQLIAVGLLLTMVLFYLAERFRLNDYMLFIGAAFLSYVMFVTINHIEWMGVIPEFLAFYLYKSPQTLNNFPLFPWLAYLFGGAALGVLYAKKPDVFRTTRFAVIFTITGTLFMVFAHAMTYSPEFYAFRDYGAVHNLHLLLLRFGVIMLINGALSFFLKQYTSAPRWLILIGRNSLLVYVAHLFVVYGSAWNTILNLSYAYKNSLTPVEAAGTSVMVILSMIVLVYSVQYGKKLVKAYLSSRKTQ